MMHRIGRVACGRLATALVLAGGLAGAPAAAEVVERRDDGFVLAFQTTTRAAPETILDTLGRPADWWSSDHTWSGSAANLRLDLRPGGCWCEDLPGGGGVRHGEVVMVWPERGLVRLEAPLGPLQTLGVAAVLTVSWAPEPDGPGGSRSLSWNFRVNGPGAGALADPVHGVMQTQFERLATQLEATARE